jgi:NAD(P)H-flavin reductase
MSPAELVAQSKKGEPVAVRPPLRRSPFVLQLVQMTQQTPDAKTLRFAVHGQQHLDALPGQFLTFSFSL